MEVDTGVMPLLIVNRLTRYGAPPYRIRVACAWNIIQAWVLTVITAIAAEFPDRLVASRILTYTLPKLMCPINLCEVQSWGPFAVYANEAQDYATGEQIVRARCTQTGRVYYVYRLVRRDPRHLIAAHFGFELTPSDGFVYRSTGNQFKFFGHRMRKIDLGSN